MKNPAVEKMLAQEIKFMEAHLENFKKFVTKAMADNAHEHFEDHNEFLMSMLAEFIEMHNVDGEN